MSRYNNNALAVAHEFFVFQFFGDSRPWVATRYCRDRSVVRWSWSIWNVWRSGTDEWKDETSQMPGGHSSQQWYKDRSSTCKDRFERTRHKMCRYQLNEWAWKNDENVRWNTSQTVKTLVHEWYATVSSTIREGLSVKLRNERRHRCCWSVVSFNKRSSPTLDQLFTITNKVGSQAADAYSRCEWTKEMWAVALI